MAREIHLRNSSIVAQVSDEDYEMLSKYKSWMVDKRGYVVRKKHVLRDPVTKVKKTTTVQMHREIMGFPIGKLIDHVSGVKTDNRRENLRQVTNTENQQNRGKQKNNSTGFKGVTLHKKAGKYIGHIGVDGNTKYLGLFEKAVDAARAYNVAALKYHKCPWLNDLS